ncbi:TPA: hypothetical protein I0F66_RS11555 [Enterococcus faecalis]|nr:hypothetical protein [Enterococcus faecalis]
MAVKIDGVIKKRAQSLMALNGQSYEEWLNEQHQKYLNEQADVVDQLLKKELERKKRENQQKPHQMHGGNSNGE